ncbi:hypothetical protein GGX14DRAFT_398571 [Mycena pura]|uniref:Uncharacterized protein n=1 Tax=Mycena pura TaxID=153505 RepID=A0AAD6VDB9_9AGAR|nr:hypothetical protein GGX14DRAFT_398571 [Mycena pura]
MLVTNTPTTTVGPSSSSSQNKTLGAAKSSSSTSNWLETSLLMAKALTAGVECLPFPYINGVFVVVVTLLETLQLLQKVKKNQRDLKDLCGDTLDIMTIVRDHLSAHGDTAATKFKRLCEDLESTYKDRPKASVTGSKRL